MPSSFPPHNPILLLSRTSSDLLALEPWFDFIVGINGHMIEDPDPNLFATEVRNCAGSSLTLEIWSAKGQRTHTVSVAVPPTNPSLGLALQLAPLSSTQHIWHVLGIPSPLSPAYRAGLLPHSDYIIGTPSGTLRGESALGELVEDHLDRTLVLWVYNSEFDVVREVELVPTRGWGGEGAVGAELGWTVFISSRPRCTRTGDLLVPANMTSPPPLASQPRVASPAEGISPASRQRGKARPGASPNRAFDDYFAEGEQKSREQDYAPSRKGTPLPPPPKAGISPVQAEDTTSSTAPPVEGEPGPTQEE
ncbi:hypothetical protein N7512_008884 [Penicillium capsulatum]|nr:hypothetical protein N7512_008884 [Penicillium capsulatum]